MNIDRDSQWLARTSGKINLTSEIALLCDKSFLKIRTKLNKKTPILFLTEDKLSNNTLANETIKQCKEGIRSYIKEYRSDVHINFRNEISFTAYDTAYFYRNLYKMLIASAYAMTEYPDIANIREITDIGCGVGTFSLAWGLLSEEMQGNKLSISLIDRHDFQLKMASAVVSKIIHPLSISVYRGDALELHDSNYSIHLIGYVFCSNIDEVESLDYRRIRSIIGYVSVIVDYENIIERMEPILKNIGYHTKKVKVRAKTKSNFITDIKSVGITANILIAIAREKN